EPYEVIPHVRICAGGRPQGRSLPRLRRGTCQASSDKGIEAEKKHMKRKITVLTLCALLLALCASAEAQQPTKIPQIGYLSYGSEEIDKSLVAALQQGLRELGYLEGRNIVIEQRYAAGRSEKLPEVLAELIRLKLDVLVTAGDPAANAAKKATSAIPI